MINKEQLKQIIQDLIEVCDSESLLNGKDSVSLDNIFSQACSYQRGLIANENKERTYFKNDSKDSGIIPPTPKQIAVLKKEGYEIPKTKEEATQILKTYFKNLEEKYI